MGLPEGSPSFFAFFAQWRPSRSFTPVAPSCPCARLPAFCTPSCPRPCNRRNASSFSMSLHAGGLPSAHLVSFSMSLRTSAWGPRKGATLCGEVRPCNRTYASVFCLSLRTSAHTGVAIRVPAWKLCKLAILRANLWRFSDSPKVLLFVLLYCKENGLPRRFAPRNDMLKHGRCPQGNDVAPGEFVTLFGFAQSIAFRFALLRGERIVPSLRSSQ